MAKFEFGPGKQQATVKYAVAIDGDAGFVDDRAKVTIYPAKEDTGIVFEAWDTVVPADIKYAVTDPNVHTTILEKDGQRVFTIEHLLAALSSAGVTNAYIKTLPNGHVPFLDGSATGFMEVILDGGIVPQKSNRLCAYVKESFEVASKDGWVKVSPKRDGLRVLAEIDFPKPIGKQGFIYNHSSESFCLNLAWARTFAYNPFDSIEKTKKKLPGFYLTKNDANMIVYRDGEYVTPLRRKDEPIRHKVLDILGDLALVPCEISAELRFYKPSHELNRKLAKEFSIT